MKCAKKNHMVTITGPRGWGLHFKRGRLSVVHIRETLSGCEQWQWIRKWAWEGIGGGEWETSETLKIKVWFKKCPGKRDLKGKKVSGDRNRGATEKRNFTVLVSLERLMEASWSPITLTLWNPMCFVSVYQSINLSIYSLFIYLFIYLVVSICLSVCLSAYLWITC